MPSRGLAAELQGQGTPALPRSRREMPASGKERCRRPSSVVTLTEGNRAERVSIGEHCSRSQPTAPRLPVVGMRACDQMERGPSEFPLTALVESGKSASF